MPLAIHTPEWVKDAVFYQIFPDRFAQSSKVAKPNNLQAWGADPHLEKYQGGDLLGVVEHLDYLVELGINAIYFCPVFQAAANHRYHTHDYYQVDPMLGGNQALRTLLDEAHSRGIKVILDGVFNHASRGFFQFSDVLENGPHSAYLDWFHVYNYPLRPYSTDGDPGYASWWGNRALPKFNTDTPAVREFLWDVAEYWIRFGIDGWRLDVPNEINDDSFWQEFRKRVKNINPNAYIVGEIWDDARRWLHGDQFDAVMNYMFSRPVIGYFGSRSLRPDTYQSSGYGHIPALQTGEFAHRISGLLGLYPNQITLAQLNLLGSHDTPRFRNVVGGDESAFQLAHLFQMTYVGVPCIYYGDEIGMHGGPDPDCRRAFPWHDPSQWDHNALEYSKKLIAARKDSLALRRGIFAVLKAEGDLLVYRRSYGSDHAFVVMNTGHDTVALTLPEIPTGHYREIVSGDSVGILPDHTFYLPPRAGRLYLPTQGQ